MKLLISVLLIGTALIGRTQNILIPSENSFERKWIKNTSYEMAWYAVKDTVKFEIGKLKTNLSINGETLMVVSQVIVKNSDTPWFDTTIAYIKTLSPIRHSSHNMQRDMELHFGKVVTGFYRDKMKNVNTTISDTTTTAYFDSNLYPTLIGWLTLHDGYSQDISIYDYNPSAKIGTMKAFVKNVYSGTLQTDKNGTRNVWVVTVNDEIGGGENGICIYYFDKEDRKLWKQEINAHGRKMMMKAIE